MPDVVLWVGGCRLVVLVSTDAKGLWLLWGGVVSTKVGDVYFTPSMKPISKLNSMDMTYIVVEFFANEGNSVKSVNIELST